MPQQVELQKLPSQISSVFGGGDQLVIVEPNARRVVAIVPNIG